MRRSPALVDALARHDDVVAALQAQPRVVVEVPWPDHWDGGSLDEFVHRLWDALAPGIALGPWVSLGTHANAPYHVKLTADGHGIACSAQDFAGVRGDATKTDHLVVHAAWMISTYELSDCAMSTLVLEIRAHPDHREAVTAVVRQRAALASAPTS